MTYHYSSHRNGGWLGGSDAALVGEVDHKLAPDVAVLRSGRASGGPTKYLTVPRVFGYSRDASKSTEV